MTSPGPPPPVGASAFTALEHQTWDTFDVAESALKEAAMANGFAAVKRKTENWHQALGHYRRHVYECHKGFDTHHTQSLGKRKRTAARDNCPWSAYLTYFVRDKKWRFGFTRAKKSGEMLDRHTHPMSNLASGIPANRRFRRPLVVADIITMGSNPEYTAADIVDELTKKHPGIGLVRKDVINILAKDKLEKERKNSTARGPKTPRARGKG